MSFTFVHRARPALIACLGLSLLFGHLPASQAALVVSGTRVVFPGGKPSVSLIVSNPSERTYAVQTWVNTEADDTTTAVPFINSPSLFRLEPGKEQQVKLNSLPHTLPEDRESLFFFNVQEILQVQDQPTSHVLNIALRTRLKLFYRPASLKGNPVERLKDLQWSITQEQGQTWLQVDNPSPFHLSFTRIDIAGNGQPQRLNSPAMAAPMSRQRYRLDAVQARAGLQVTFAAINDYGGVTPDVTATVQSSP